MSCSRDSRTHVVEAVSSRRTYYRFPMAGAHLPRRTASVVIAVVLTIRGSAQVIPSTDAPPGPRTGIIIGQVVDATTGAAVSEAIVMLAMPKYFNNPTAPKGRVMADGEGRFFFTHMPAGEFYVQHTDAGYGPSEDAHRRQYGEILRRSRV